jgi:hypothetical protein
MDANKLLNNALVEGQDAPASLSWASRQWEYRGCDRRSIRANAVSVNQPNSLQNPSTRLCLLLPLSDET